MEATAWWLEIRTMLRLPYTMCDNIDLHWRKHVTKNYYNPLLRASASIIQRRIVRDYIRKILNYSITRPGTYY